MLNPSKVLMASLGKIPLAAKRIRLPARWATIMPINMTKTPPAVLMSSCESDFLNILNVLYAVLYSTLCSIKSFQMRLCRYQ